MRILIIGIISAVISFAICSIDDLSGRITISTLGTLFMGGLMFVWAILANRLGMTFIGSIFNQEEFNRRLRAAALKGKNWTLSSLEKMVLAFFWAGVLGALGSIYIKLFR